MYAVYKQAHPPTGLEFSMYCNFFNNSERNLVVAGTSQLYVYRLNRDSEVGRPAGAAAPRGEGVPRRGGAPARGRSGRQRRAWSCPGTMFLDLLKLCWARRPTLGISFALFLNKSHEYVPCARF